MSDPDEDLRALLRRTDPAASLPPLDPAGVDRRTEQAMQDESTPTPTTGASGGGTRRRVIAVAAVTLAVAVVAGAVLATTLPGAGPTRLSAAGPAAGDGMIASACAPVSAETLGRNALAFEGVVTGVEGDAVTLRVTEVYRGEVAEEVVVPQQADTGGLPDEFSAGAFTPDQSYLVAADAEGRIATCGQTGTASPDRRALYEAAFDR